MVALLKEDVAFGRAAAPEAVKVLVPNCMSLATVPLDGMSCSSGRCVSSIETRPPLVKLNVTVSGCAVGDATVRDALASPWYSEDVIVAAPVSVIAADPCSCMDMDFWPLRNVVFCPERYETSAGDSCDWQVVADDVAELQVALMANSGCEWVPVAATAAPLVVIRFAKVRVVGPTKPDEAWVFGEIGTVMFRSAGTVTKAGWMLALEGSGPARAPVAVLKVENVAAEQSEPVLLGTPGPWPQKLENFCRSSMALMIAVPTPKEPMPAECTPRTRPLAVITNKYTEVLSVGPGRTKMCACVGEPGANMAPVLSTFNATHKPV